VALYLDASAFVARHVDFPGRLLTLIACAADADWCTSAVSLPESLVLADRLSDDAVERDFLRGALRADWERMAVVPLDTLCLERAAELATEHPLRLVDAIHLAAADRLPPPVTYATFDDHQIPVALALGFEIVSS
jgi:predicted nucleic acid-binding protein